MCKQIGCTPPIGCILHLRPYTFRLLNFILTIRSYMCTPLSYIPPLRSYTCTALSSIPPLRSYTCAPLSSIPPLRSNTCTVYTPELYPTPQILYVYTPELYPTTLRTRGFAFCNLTGYAGAFFAPFIPEVLVSYPTNIFEDMQCHAYIIRLERIQGKTCKIFRFVSNFFVLFLIQRIYEHSHR